MPPPSHPAVRLLLVFFGETARRLCPPVVHCSESPLLHCFREFHPPNPAVESSEECGYGEGGAAARLVIALFLSVEALNYREVKVLFLFLHVMKLCLLLCVCLPKRLCSYLLESVLSPLAGSF